MTSSKQWHDCFGQIIGLFAKFGSFKVPSFLDKQDPANIS
jgi:hypothetical protein